MPYSVALGSFAVYSMTGYSVDKTLYQLDETRLDLELQPYICRRSNLNNRLMFRFFFRHDVFSWLVELSNYYSLEHEEGNHTGELHDLIFSLSFSDKNDAVMFGLF